MRDITIYGLLIGLLGISFFWAARYEGASAQLRSLRFMKVAGVVALLSSAALLLAGAFISPALT